MNRPKVKYFFLKDWNWVVSRFLSGRSVPEEHLKIARHFNAGKGFEKIESRRDG
jgi:hypothetical protein